MFFFIGLTMATIQGAYARRIRPGREIAAVKRVWSSPGLGAGGARALRRQWGLSDRLCRPQAILLLVPASLFVGWGHTLPILGLGLLLYSWGEWACRQEPSRRLRAGPAGGRAGRGGACGGGAGPVGRGGAGPGPPPTSVGLSSGLTGVFPGVSPAAAVVVPCLSSVVAGYGERPCPGARPAPGRRSEGP